MTLLHSVLHSDVTPGKTPINEQLFWATQRLSQQAAIKSAYNVHCTVFKISDMFIDNKMLSSVINLVLKSEISGNSMFQQLPDKSWEVRRSEAGKLLKRCCDRIFFYFLFFINICIILLEEKQLPAQNLVMNFWKRHRLMRICSEHFANLIWFLLGTSRESGNEAVSISVRQSRQSSPTVYWHSDAPCWFKYRANLFVFIRGLSRLDTSNTNVGEWRESCLYTAWSL